MKKRKKLVITALTTAGLFVFGAFSYMHIAKHIPYSYRQDILDVIDYVVGKNVFNRMNSMQ